MSTLIQVFAKAPVLGQVKTRIAKTLGGEVALALHKYLCKKVIDTALCSEADQVEVWTTDSDGVAFFQSYGLECLLQQGRSLGTRMDFALRSGLARYDRVIIIGADALSLTPRYIGEAFTALLSSDVAIGPALDGGYVLVGATKPVPVIFRDVPWGSAQVLSVTLDRLFHSGLSFHIMHELWDVDTVQDLQQYAPDLLKQIRPSKQDQ